MLIVWQQCAGGAEDAHSRLMRSLDGGRTWRSFADPCGFGPDGENDATSIATAPDGFFAILCRSRMSPLERAFVLTSSNSGRSFGRRFRVPAGGATMLAAGSSRTLAVTVLRGGGFEALASRDGGRTWRSTLLIPTAQGDSGLFSLGFQSARTARVSFGTASIWATRDAGETWSRSDPF